MYSVIPPSEKLSLVTAVQVHTVLETHYINNSIIAFLLQSAGSTKEEKDKGKKGKKGKGKEEPVKKPASQKPHNVETAAKKPEQMGGGEDTQERGEEGGAAEQEEKVHDTLERSTIFAMYVYS